jgi:hypothetical protein
MNYAFLKKGIICIPMMFLLAVGMVGQQQKFSLDDFPHAPYAGPNVPGYGSAEDEYGVPLPASYAGLLGGSPSLLLGFQDSDILIPGVALFVTFPPPPYYVDAFSYNHDDYPANKFPNIKIRFSVDRATGGTSTMTTAASYQQAALNQQPADIFQGLKTFPHPGTFPPPPAMTAASNKLIYDDGFFPLATGWIYTDSVTLAPAITIGSHDNIDGFNELPNVVSPTEYLYFSAHPAEIVSPPCSGLQSGNIYVLSGGTGSAIWMFAPASSMGLHPEEDSIDALVVWDMDNSGCYDPGIDYAIYSLAPGSATLNNSASWDGGTVFWTNFNGTSTVYAYAVNLGIGTYPSPPLLGADGEPNVDALEIKTMKTTIPPSEPPIHGDPGDPE